MADVQTGFGPFIAVYLTIHKWTQGEIGAALSIGTLTAMVSQIPAGLMLDALPQKRAAAAAAIVAIAACALMMGIWPERLPVMLAEILHGFASCVIGPAVAAISLALVGQQRFGARLGRNARWGAIGNGLAAALMGATGRYISARAVFWLTALLSVPTAASLLMIGRIRQAAVTTETAGRSQSLRAMLHLLSDRRLAAFATCTLLFHLSNAAMLPLAAGRMTERAGSNAPILIAGAIVLPQLVMAAIAPWIGRAADGWGRRAVLLLGFSALPIRGVLLALLSSPWLLVPVQALDGVSAAALGVLLPLVAADLTQGKNHFNLCIGLLGLAAGGGAMLSTLLAGFLADWLGANMVFLGLASTGLLACGVVWLAMPETRPATTVKTPASVPSPVA